MTGALPPNAARSARPRRAATNQSSKTIAIARSILARQGSGGRMLGSLIGAGARRLLQPDTAASGGTRRALADELDAGRVEGADELHQGIDRAADHPVARFHALDGRHGQPREFGKRALVEA